MFFFTGINSTVPDLMFPGGQCRSQARSLVSKSGNNMLPQSSNQAAGPDLARTLVGLPAPRKRPKPPSGLQVDAWRAIEVGSGPAYVMGQPGAPNKSCAAAGCSAASSYL